MCMQNVASRYQQMPVARTSIDDLVMTYETGKASPVVLCATSERSMWLTTYAA